MTDYEHMIISAIRYVLGKQTHIVSTVVNYVISDIDNLSDMCLALLKRDIEETKYFNNDYGREQWLKLLNKTNNLINERGGK